MPELLQTYNQFMLLLAAGLLGENIKNHVGPSDSCIRGIRASLSPPVTAARVAADEEECHPFLPPRGGLQIKKGRGTMLRWSVQRFERRRALK
uniref:Umc1300 n=1 Tax=Arundo donax TaxID=35708 RepID=A0A0A9GC39_ARUDO